jgi:hypothetical protein
MSLHKFSLKPWLEGQSRKKGWRITESSACVCPGVGCVHIRVSACVYMCVWWVPVCVQGACVWLCVYPRICVYACVYVGRVYICGCVYTYASVCVHVYVWLRVHTCISVCVSWFPAITWLALALLLLRNRRINVQREHCNALSFVKQQASDRRPTTASTVCSALNYVTTDTQCDARWVETLLGQGDSAPTPQSPFPHCAWSHHSSSGTPLTRVQSHPLYFKVCIAFFFKL